MALPDEGLGCPIQSSLARFTTAGINVLVSAAPYAWLSPFNDRATDSLPLRMVPTANTGEIVQVVSSTAVLNSYEMVNMKAGVARTTEPAAYGATPVIASQYDCAYGSPLRGGVDLAVHSRSLAKAYP
jgi:hypothetical protein